MSLYDTHSLQNNSLFSAARAMSILILTIRIHHIIFTIIRTFSIFPYISSKFKTLQRSHNLCVWVTYFEKFEERTTNTPWKSVLWGYNKQNLFKVGTKSTWSISGQLIKRIGNSRCWFLKSVQNSGKIKTIKVKQDIDLFGKSRTLMPGRKTVVFIVYFLEHLKPSQTLVTLKGKKDRETGRY